MLRGASRGLASSITAWATCQASGRPTNEGLPDAAGVLSTTRYVSIEFCSSLRQGKVFACQVHPERSGRQGLLIYSNMARLINESRWVGGH